MTSAGRWVRRPAGRPLGWSAAVLGLFALLAVVAPILISPRSLSLISASGPALAPPSWRFPLGTDENGLSVLDLALVGSRVSLGVGFLASCGAVGAGTLIGLLTGVFRGPAAAALSWLMDWSLTLPQVPVAIAVVAVLRPGVLPLVLAIALTSWAPLARVIRAAVRAAGAQPHLDRVRALGAGEWYLARVHLLPEVLPVVLANAALTLANAILAEAAFSFLGLGEPSQVSWGSMLRQASTSGALTAGAWWYVLTPGVAVIIVVSAAGACANALSSAHAELS